MNTRFKVEIKKKNLNPEDNIKCEAIVNELSKRFELERNNDNEFYSYKNDDSAFACTAFFASELKDHSQFFDSIKCFDKESNEEEEFLNL